MRPASATERIRHLARPWPSVAATAFALQSELAHAAVDDSPEWIQWAVLGAIALLVLGVALRMILAARFPKGYGKWASDRRDEFAQRNAQWDAEDDAKR